MIAEIRTCVEPEFQNPAESLGTEVNGAALVEEKADQAGSFRHGKV